MWLYCNYSKQPKNRYDRVEYSCSHCEYVATQGSTLNKHIESKHEGVRFPCPQFEYAATVANAHKIRVENKHEDWDILVPNATMPQLEQVIWWDMLKETYEENILALIVNKLQVYQVI